MESPLNWIIGGDLLSNLQMKPPWEVLQDFSLAAITAIAGYAAYVVMSATGHSCVPFDNNEAQSVPFNSSNVTGCGELSEAQHDFVNHYCSVDWFWPLMIVTITFQGTLSQLFLSKGWLYNRVVTNAFHNFAKASEIMGELGLDAEEIKRIATNPASSEQDIKVRKMCLLLWKNKTAESLYKIYRRRYISIGVLSACLDLFLAILVILNEIGKTTYACQLREEDVDRLKEVLLPCSDEFLCVSKIHDRLYVILVFLLLVSFAQLICFAWFMPSRMIKRAHEDEAIAQKPMLASKSLLNAKRCAYFILAFWNNPPPIGHPGADTVVKYLFSEKILRKMKENILIEKRKEKAERDEDFVKLFLYLSKYKDLDEIKEGEESIAEENDKPVTLQVKVETNAGPSGE